jgi:predicted dehydrogenase
MVEAAHKAGRVLGVMENVRYAAGSRHARWAIEQGLIGAVQMVASVSIGSTDWAPDRVVADTPWRHRRVEAGGGPSLDIGVHMFHGLRYICGDISGISALLRTFEPVRLLQNPAEEAPERVAADADDAYFSLLEFAGGGIGMASVTWAGHGEPTGLPEGRVIYGSKGVIKGGRLLADGQAPVALAGIFAERAPAELNERYFPLGLTDTFALGSYDFLRAIETGGEMEASGEEGLRDVATAFALIESSARRCMVLVEDVYTGKVATEQVAINEHYGLRG